MKAIKISCYSRCGSYFGACLQRVTVLAETKEQAIEILKSEGYYKSFIYPEKEWEIEILCDDLSIPSVIESDVDSDY